MTLSMINNRVVGTDPFYDFNNRGVGTDSFYD